MSNSGRWTGRDYVWSCPCCDTVMCASQAPEAWQWTCLSCVVQERNRLLAEVERLDGRLCEMTILYLQAAEAKAKAA